MLKSPEPLVVTRKGPRNGNGTRKPPQAGVGLLVKPTNRPAVALARAFVRSIEPDVPACQVPVPVSAGTPLIPGAPKPMLV